MDIIENGQGPGFLGGRAARLVIGVLVVTVVAVIGVGEFRRRHRVAAPAPAVSASEPASTAALVDSGTDIDFRTDDGTMGFVVRTTLKNFNRVPVSVQAGTAPQSPGLPGLVTAVMAGDMGEEIPAYAAVVNAANKPITLPRNGAALLAIAGRVVCDAAMLSRNTVTVTVDGTDLDVTVPRVGEKTWAVAMRDMLC